MEPRSTPPDQPTPPAPSEDDNTGAPVGMHLVTFTHEGRFWDVHLEFVEEPLDPDSCRARLCFVPTDQGDHEEPVRTAVIIIEPSYDEARTVARGLDRYHLAAMLRSVT